MPSVSLFRPRVTRNGKTTATKIWHAAWRDPQTGRRCTRTTGTKNKQSAKQFATKLEDQLYRRELGTYDPAEDYKDLLFADAKKRFIHAQTQRLRPKSVSCYDQSLRLFENAVKPKELRKIDRRTMTQFIAKRRKNVEPSTINRDLRQVRAFLNWCKDEGLLAITPSFKGLFLKVDEAEPTWVPDEDVRAVIKALADPEIKLTKRSREWWGVFIRVALFTGMRRSELLGVKWSDVDFQRASVRVIRLTSKGRKDRTYEDAHSLVKLLRVWFQNQGQPKASAAVLPYDRDPRGLYKDWDRILLHAKIPAERRFTPHDCRSSCVSELLAQGVALTTVRDWVGHSSVTVTERYYAATRSDRRRVASEREVL